MQSINHDFTRPASPQLPYLNPITTSKNLLVQTSFDAAHPANKIIHVTNYNNNNVPPPNVCAENAAILEESCDSYLDSDTEDNNTLPNNRTSGQCDDVSNHVTSPQLSFISALNKVGGCSSGGGGGGVKTENVDPYHIPTRFQSPTMSDGISPQKELKNLIKEVSETSASNVTNNNREYSPIDSPVIDKLIDDVPRIEIVEEPETVCSYCYCFSSDLLLLFCYLPKHSSL